MKIMNRVTWEYLKKNKKRTIVTILGVIVSVAMITAVSTFFGTFTDWMRRDWIEQDGEWHVQFRNVAVSDTARITGDENTAEAGLSRRLGWGSLGLPKNTARQGTNDYLNICEYTKEALEFRHLRLAEGRYPENANELVVRPSLADVLGKSISVGDTLTLPIGERIWGDGGVKVNSFYTQEGEEFHPRETRTYTIVGLLKADTYTHVSKSAEVYTLLDPAALAPTDTVDVTVRAAATPGDFYDRVTAFAETFPNGGVEFNDDLLRTMGLLDDSYLRGTFLLVGGIVGLIILIGSVMLIYNAFAISVSERARQLGMLASVGATKKQKRDSVFFEGAVIGAAAIPLGIVFGILGIGITFHLVDPMIRSFISISVPLQIKVEPYAILLAVAFSALTIFISLWVPARRAARITPIEAIRQTQDIKLKGRQLKTSRLSRKLFGFEGELALKNLKRNKKRYRATVFSLTVSILLFLTAATFTHYINSAYGLTEMEVRYDLSADFYDNPETNRQAAQAIRELDSVTLAVSFRDLPAQTALAFDELHPTLQSLVPEEERAGLAENPFFVTLRALDNDALREYAKQSGADYDSLQDPTSPRGILLNSLKYQRGHNYTAASYLPASRKGASLSLVSASGGEPAEGTKHEFSIELAALAGEAPITDVTNSFEWHSLVLYVSDAVYEALVQTHYPAPENQFSPVNTLYMVIQASDPDRAEKEIDALITNTLSPTASYSLFNLTASLRKQQQMGSVVAIFVYGFVSLITLIAVANTFNTISTSVALRRREFAMLKSVGMTPGGFNRMIRFESVFYGLKSLLFGLPASFVVMLLLYRALGRNFEFGFSLPWGAVLGAVFGVFLIVGMTMLYSGSKVKKANIIDALTEENL